MTKTNIDTWLFSLNEANVYVLSVFHSLAQELKSEDTLIASMGIKRVSNGQALLIKCV